MRDLIIALGAGIAALVVWSGWQAWEMSHKPIGGGTVCTMEAKLCPDGSSVGRTGPHCEFATCPGERSNKYQSVTFTIDGAPMTLTTSGVSYFGNEAIGDLNSDGEDDAAFLVTYNGGGSGTFYYIIVALKTGSDTYQGMNAIFLGDRIAPQTTEIKDGMVTVNYADRTPTDPMTAAPSMGVSKHFAIEKGVLVAR